eukprot:scaffold6194_cov131-Isochrysis_galbana.AAC.3
MYSSALFRLAHAVAHLITIADMCIRAICLLELFAVMFLVLCTSLLLGLSCRSVVDKHTQARSACSVTADRVIVISHEPQPWHLAHCTQAYKRLERRAIRGPQGAKGGGSEKKIFSRNARHANGG